MAANIKRHTWLGVIFCFYFSPTAVLAEEQEGLSEGSIIGLACLFGTISVALVLCLTCSLVRLYRRRQFVKFREERQLLDIINKEFSLSGSLKSLEFTPSTKMPMLVDEPVPTGGERVQKYSDWARYENQPSPLLYSKRTHDVRPVQRVFTVPTNTRTVVTQKPKYFVRQNRTTSAPPPLVRTNIYAQDRYGYTKAHFLPARGPTQIHTTKRYISQPQWRQEVIRPPPVQYVETVSAPAPPPVQYVETVSAPAPPPVQYIETVSTSSPAHSHTVHRSGDGDTYHIKLNTSNMNYTKEKLGGSSSNILETSTYRERTHTDPGEYTVNTKLSTYQPRVLQGGHYTIPQREESSYDWKLVEGTTGVYQISKGWAGQGTEVKTQTTEFHDNQEEAAIILRHESQKSEIEQAIAEPIVPKRTYEEVVIVDYVDNTGTQKSPLSTSTPRFTEHDMSPIDAVLNGESPGSSSSSSSSSDSGENRRKRSGSGLS